MDARDPRWFGEDPATDRRFLTREELARRWRVSVRTLERLHAARLGPPRMKIKGKVLFCIDDVLRHEQTMTDRGRRR